jgi:hypothetical protein
MNIRFFIIIMLFSLPIPFLRIVSIFNFMTISRFLTVELRHTTDQGKTKGKQINTDDQ